MTDANKLVVLVADGIHQLKLGMVNAYLIDTPVGLLLVDTGFPKSTDKIFAAMKTLGHQPEDLRHIFLTHAHPDHVGSLAALVRATGAETWMHRIDAPVVEKAVFRPVHPAPGLMAKLLFALMHLLPNRVEPTGIDHRIDEDTALPFGDWRAIHAPGHCAGQMVLLSPQRRLLIAADVCMNLRALRQPLVNENAALGRDSLRRIAALDFDTACFGHGKTTPQAAGERFRQAFAN